MDIKRFTLHLTASAILALNAEAAHAAPCPVLITDNSLAGQVCDFSANSSVTVANGGEVAGISMVGYNPPSPSQIAIDAGGVVSNITSTGISIVSSSLSNGIINNGTINTRSSGLNINNSSTIAGSIDNNGLIVTVTGTGIRVVNSSTINGGISNSGTISAGGVDNGIVLGFNSVINGDISNTGAIHADDNGNGILILGSSTLNGNLSNSGSITAAGDGIAANNVVTINGSLTNTGLINAGNIGIRITNASMVSGNIANIGAINAGNLGISVHSQSTVNSITNSGIIRAGSTGISVSSSSTINGGISNSGIIQGDTRAIYVDPSSIINNIDILGQQARIIGSVDAANTDVNITSGAIFTSEGSFNVNNFNIAENAVFNMQNTITTQNALNNSGTLALGDNTQTLAGDYIQNAGGIFQIGITDANNYGQLIVTNGVDLSQSGDINVDLSPNASLHVGEVFSDVISGSTLIAPTDGYIVTDNSFMWKFIASTSATMSGVDLTATINPAVYNVCLGEYCQGAAATIIGQVASGNPVFNPYNLLSSSSALRTAASQATPELSNENIQVIQSITRSLTDIAPMWNRLHGVSKPESDLDPSSHLWIKPYGTTMTQNENNTVDGFNAGAYGAAVGNDVQLPNRYVLGGALAAGSDTITGKAKLNGQAINSEIFQGMLYGSKIFSHHIYLAAEGLIGYENNNTRRFIPLFLSTAAGSFSSWFTDLRAQLGWNIDTLNQRLVLTPELDANYLFINQTSYREYGSPMDLAVNSNSLSPLDLGAYGHAAYHLARLNNQQDITLTAYAGIACDVLDNQPRINAAFIAGGPYFSTVGAQFNQLVFRGGLGLSMANPTRPLSLNLNYDLQAGNNAYSGAAAVTIIYHFDI